jgi:MoaA/NifB/PqqE/SkfB family radical SAM enzyme
MIGDGILMRNLVIKKLKRYIVQELMKLFMERQELFSAVEVETINRCNGTCSFCPVNAGEDIRPYAKMNDSIFQKIVGELEMLNYAGFLGLQSNNEPFLDKDIINRIAVARRRVPRAIIYMYTNGQLLTVEKVQQVFAAGLDILTINDYNDVPEYHENIKGIIAEVGKPHYAALQDKIIIAMRDRNEVLTNRGGTAPNKDISTYKEYLSLDKTGCILPFRQIVIRPTGQISLCCQDAVGQVTLGDVSKSSLQEIWTGLSYQKIRNSLLEGGRGSLPICCKCDLLIAGRADLTGMIKKKILSYAPFKRANKHV